ncbi:hypothetical protein X801_04813 [Opisthorchis viverrini]|uniref:Uncharacterized protein n=1 Tax=Opisthorchis viverrini TaxID=6198 RepID=A0A1S8WY28_OPIVI|nr:hypothetical protein X801_04813 [Opisthorchis viverrini]
MSIEETKYFQRAPIRF